MCLPEVLPFAERAALEAWASTLYPFQREWLFEPSKFALCNKARQIGMSHTTAAVAVLWAVFFAETTTVISIGQLEANEVLEKAKRHAQALTELGCSWAKHSSNATEIKFENGGRVIALPSSTGGRGFSGNVFLDEFAYLQHPERVWDGASAVTMHGGRMRVSSTPNGVGNPFHSLVTDPKQNKGWRLFQIDIHRAIADGMKLNMDHLWTMAHGDPRLFSQLFECSFLDGQAQYIPTELINGACLDDTTVIGGVAYAGLDIGMTNDLSSLTIVVQTEDGRVWEQETITCKRTEWNEQMAMIARSYLTWGWRRLCLDSTGMGLVPAQLLQQEYGTQRVEPVTFTNQSKEELATGLYQALADKMLLIRNDPSMVKDLCSLRRIVTEAGNIRFDAPRTADGHADRAWSLALAVHACGTKPASRKDSGSADYQSTI